MNNEFEIINNQNEECGTVLAETIHGAQMIVQSRINRDKSLYHADGYREVKNMKTKQTLPLRG